VLAANVVVVVVVARRSSSSLTAGIAEAMTDGEIEIEVASRIVIVVVGVIIAPAIVETIVSAKGADMEIKGETFAAVLLTDWRRIEDERTEDEDRDRVEEVDVVLTIAEVEEVDAAVDDSMEDKMPEDEGEEEMVHLGVRIVRPDSVVDAMISKNSPTIYRLLVAEMVETEGGAVGEDLIRTNAHAWKKVDTKNRMATTKDTNKDILHTVGTVFVEDSEAVAVLAVVEAAAFLDVGEILKNRRLPEAKHQKGIRMIKSTEKEKKLLLIILLPS